MIFDLSPRIQALILDMDGVLWKDNTLLVDLPAVFSPFPRPGFESGSGDQ